MPQYLTLVSRPNSPVGLQTCVDIKDADEATQCMKKAQQPQQVVWTLHGSFLWWSG